GSKISVLRSHLGRNAPTKGVNEIVGRDCLAVGPTRVLSQVKDKLRGVVVSLPTFGQRGNRLRRFRIVFCETVEERHDDATFGLARWYLRVQRLRFIAGDIAKNVSGRRSSTAEVAVVLCRGAATRNCYRNRYQRDDELKAAGDGRKGFHRLQISTRSLS